jgi:hypothetical protein
MQRVFVFIFRVNAVTGETTAETVGTVMHDGYGFFDYVTARFFRPNGK